MLAEELSPDKTMPILLCDIDNTLVNANSQLNLALLNVLKRYGHSRLTLMTSYDLRYRLKTSIEKNVSRFDVLRRVRQEGVSVDAVVTSASPYQEECQTLGQYYEKQLLPYESKAKEYYLVNGMGSLAKLMVSIEGLDQFAAEELESIETHINESMLGIPPWQDEACKGGKQHLIIHSIMSHKTKGHRHFIILDDKPEVHNVVKRAQDEKIFGEGVFLYPFQVDFTAHFQESEEEYEDRLKRAYEALGLELTLPTTLQKSACKLFMNSSGFSDVSQEVKSGLTTFYRLEEYQQIVCLGNQTEKLLHNVLPSNKEVITNSTARPVESVIGWLNLQHDMLFSHPSSQEKWNFHCLGLPDAKVLNELKLAFAGEEILLLVKCYECLNAVYDALKSIAKPVIDLHFLNKGRGYHKQIKVYRHLLKSAQHVLLKLALVNTWCLENHKVKATLAPILDQFGFDFKQAWVRDLYANELPTIDLDEHKKRSLLMVKAIAENKTINTILNHWIPEPSTFAELPHVSTSPRDEKTTTK